MVDSIIVSRQNPARSGGSFFSIFRMPEPEVILYIINEMGLCEYYLLLIFPFDFYSQEISEVPFKGYL